jgi:hypothetical protein
MEELITKTNWLNQKVNVRIIKTGALGFKFNGLFVLADRVEIEQEEGSSHASVFFMKDDNIVANFSYMTDSEEILSHKNCTDGMKITLQTIKKTALTA